MPRLRIDNHEVEVPEGGTILDAARRLGLDIPTLCFHEGYKPSTSCMVCLVRVKGSDRLVPSCATTAKDGMEVESETDEIRRIRKMGLELLLADHAGDCIAPCQSTCPAHMDIPLMLRRVAAGQFDDAIATVRKDIALAAVLGRVCPAPCENICRRRDVDSPVAICFVKRYAADVDLATETPYLPPCKPNSGKKVAIVGAGPAGLAAAYHLLQQGHACTLFDDHTGAGGSLRTRFDEKQLPRAVLDAEIAVIERLGARFQLNTRIGRDVSLDELRKTVDALLLAPGSLDVDDLKRLGAPVQGDHIQVDAATHETPLPGVFAAGELRKPTKLAVKSLADGKAASICIDQYLSGAAVTGPPVSFNCTAGRLAEEEIEELKAGAGLNARVTAPGNLSGQQAKTEASRCLQCDCGKQTDCRLRYYAQRYGAKPTRYRGKRRRLERHLQHGDVLYEPGKCILCGLCVQIAAEAGEPLGLTLVGRGFDVRVAVPFDRSIAEGLQHAASRCAETCPTGAIVLRSGGHTCRTRDS